MPDAICAFAHSDHRGMLSLVVAARHRFVVIIATEPGMANIQTSIHMAEIVVEYKILIIDAARKPGPGNFYLSCFVRRYARVCDGNPHNRAELKFAGRGAAFTYPAL